MFTFLTDTDHIPYPPWSSSGDHMVPVPPDLSITSVLSLPTVKLKSFSRPLHWTSICFPGLLLVSVWPFSPQIYIMTLFRNHITTPGLIHTSSICSPFFHQTTDIYIYISPPDFHIWHSSWTWPLKVMAPCFCKMLGTTNAVTQCAMSQEMWILMHRIVISH